MNVSDTTLMAHHNGLRYICFAFVLMIMTIAIGADDEVLLIASGKNKAIVQINGERYVLTKQAPTVGGVHLIDIKDNVITIALNGNEITLDPENTTALVLDDASSYTLEDAPIVLWQNTNGFFFADGKVNGATVKFLVDTGADAVTFNSIDADNLGIDYEDGEKGYASTASGIAHIRTLKVKTVSVEHIVLHNVRVSVVMGPFPEIPLLGGSFLNKVDMAVTGNKMELKKR